MIPNPKKKLIVNYSLSDVKKAILNYPQFTHNCKLLSNNEILNQISLVFSETLSLGSKLIIELVEIEANKTELNIEVARVVGSFNKSVEVTNANIHLNTFTNIVSQLLVNPDLKPNLKAIQQKKNGEIVWVVVFVVIMLSFIIKVFG